MTITQIAHVHVYVKDRPAAVEWLTSIWGVTPDAQDPEMSLFTFGTTQLVINDAAEDVPATIAFDSTDCVHDFAKVIEQGAIAKSQPKDMPWGVKAAFVKGPGEITFEIEERLPR